MGVKDQVCLVTGGSRGIGAEIAVELAKQGAATVIINFRESGDKAEYVAEQVREYGSEAHTIRCDVTDLDQCNNMVNEIVNEFGRLDILVNNAGIIRDELILRMSSDDFDSVIATNLKGTFNMIHCASKHMIRKKYGRIVNISSVTGLYGNLGQANYAASKAGIIGLTKSVAKELAARNITCNAVAPGFIDTDMTCQLSDDEKSRLVSSIAMKRMGRPEEVAAAVVFLASKEASYLTGQVIEVSGGIM